MFLRNIAALPLVALALLAGLTACPTHTARAQVTLDQSYFPLAGDTLYTSVDGLPEDILLGPPGPDRSWDFRSLQAPFILRRPVRPATEGEGSDFFPEATLMHHLEENLEAYYLVQPGTYALLGFYGDDPADLGLQAAIPFDTPLPERRAPLAYLDVHAAETSLSVALAFDELPDEVTDELPFTPDSLRLRGVLTRQDTVDAWGTLRIPGGNYEVLRERRVEERDLRLEAYLEILGWQDITELLPEDEFLGEARTVTYFFWSPAVKEPIAQVLMDSAGQFPLQVTYKANDLTTATRRVVGNKPDVYAYPNPAIVEARFAFSGLPAGRYTLTLFNILGVEQWKKTYFIDGRRTERVNIAHLSKGSYLYSLTDEGGRTLITKRLIVIKP